MNKELIISIKNSILNFAHQNLYDASLEFFRNLGYSSDRTQKLDPPNKHEFLKLAAESPYFKNFNKENAQIDDWFQVHLLFQLTEDEIRFYGQYGIFQPPFENTLFDSYLFFAIDLGNKVKPRNKIAMIVREINKLFPMPVLVLFKTTENISLAIINRRFNKIDDSKHVLEKVTIIKDISISTPHRAHLDILSELSVEGLKQAGYEVNNFETLHKAWSNVLSTELLNRRFYEDIRNWFYWALSKVTFPISDDIEKEKITSIHLIRMLTRIIFIWFIKEKGLIDESLFDEDSLKRLINYKDKSNSTYYKAILQNLFFATLNTPMSKDEPGSRCFSSESSNHYMVHNYYRYQSYFVNKDKVLSLFSGIPFLNGGLFECLDCFDENNKEVRIDCFSDNPKNINRLVVPDFLFFSEALTVDLNEIFQTKNKKYKVNGLINILNSYKFTITENTPIEEEIALDPELLGKVFENLLAAYNPETQDTARKQTGSYYTPREIVDYMVDESLIARLSQKLQFSGISKNVENRVRDLLRYSSEPHEFDDNEVHDLINIIDGLKIIDPACGSGAFPMGMLHKIVFILHKLDYDNSIWKSQQKKKAEEQLLRDIESANKINDEKARNAAYNELELRLANIDTAFSDDNEQDYARKLFLIENCIFGVDIQPIAVQISKLRFFISLIVDQKTNPNKPNIGIIPLPNLETKIIAADALIRIDKPEQMLIGDNVLDSLEDELKRVREKHFEARTHKTKEKYRQLDRDIRNRMSIVLEDMGLSKKQAELIAKWNPYDQNTTAGFFEPEYMFGIKDGFDIVIGNPPYIDSELMTKLYSEYRQILTSIYSTAKGNWDYYIVFIQFALMAIIEDGIVCYITPNKWLTAKYASALREFVGCYISKILDCSNINVFEAGNNPLIFILNRNVSNPKSSHYISRDVFESNYTLSSYESLSYETIDKFSFSLLLVPKVDVILHLLSNDDNFGKKIAIENPCTVSEAYILSDLIKDCKEVNCGDTRYFKFINTGTIDRYVSLWGISKTTYLKHQYQYPVIKKDDLLAFSKRRNEQTAKPKLIFSGMRNFEVFLDAEGEYLAGKSTLIGFNRNQSFSLKVALGILNSDVVRYFIYTLYRTAGIDGGISFTKDIIESIPIPKLIETKHSIIETIVDYIIFLKRTPHPINPNFNNNFIADEFDRILNAIIVELYFDKEMADNQLEFFEYAKRDFNPIENIVDVVEASKVIDKSYMLFRERENKIRNNLILMEIRLESIIKQIRNP